MRRALAALLVPVLILPAACTSPTPDLYTLAAAPGATSTMHLHGVELRRIGLAGYLDRPEIVRSSAAFRLRLAENQRWGEPLGSMLDRVFTEDLVERLPNTAVFAEAGAISTVPDLVLEVDVQRFDTDIDGTLVLLAQVAVRTESATHSAEARTLRLTETPASASTHDQVAAMSRVLGQLADRVVTMLAASAVR
jgi:uncharacterized lipoprotein YmbA